MEQNLQPEAQPAPPVVAVANELIRSSLPVEKPEDGSIDQNANIRPVCSSLFEFLFYFFLIRV